MIYLERPPLSLVLADEASRKALLRHGANAAKLAPGDPRIGPRWNHFRAGETMRGVCAALFVALREMSNGKCALCETPEPRTIEHLDEKTLHPERMFDWDNVLPACNDCNTTRLHMGVRDRPIDPSATDPLSHFGWNEYGRIVPLPASRPRVEATVEMYNLGRFDHERMKRRTWLRYLFVRVCAEIPVTAETRAMLFDLLDRRSMFLGPLRDYMLRPPTPSERELVRCVFVKLPELRGVVAPWLRPPPWAPPPWEWPAPASSAG